MHSINEVIFSYIKISCKANYHKQRKDKKKSKHVYSVQSRIACHIKQKINNDQQLKFYSVQQQIFKIQIYKFIPQ